uniref:Pentatricopeptide repeat-containing protein n=1 Tax=Ananas comosus var. bracteatus TaxID=296719 RepID=A0A6V7QEF3_ANACO|nr:unnamed protein product [Ananas comosus var. bracteatus]
MLKTLGRGFKSTLFALSNNNLKSKNIATPQTLISFIPNFDASSPNFRYKNATFFSSASCSSSDLRPKLGDSNASSTHSNDLKDDDARFGASVLSDDLDEEDESECGSNDDDDNGFGALDLFDKNAASKDEKKSYKEEDDEEEEEKDESRNPIVREICRLIDLRHAWNPQMESQLRLLLRSLKPRQVSAVLRSQRDERAAVSFFYWADRQWRYRHAPEVFDVMLQLLSKTKLCEASRRIMRLMIRRGLSRRPEHFACLMLSYSRAESSGPR